MRIFDAQAFLKSNFTGPADLIRMVSGYGLGEIPYETAQKWFQRGRLPGSWLPSILCALEFEHGRSIAVREYFV